MTTAPGTCADPIPAAGVTASNACCERPDSNRRTPGPQPGARPAELRSPRRSNLAPPEAIRAAPFSTTGEVGARPSLGALKNDAAGSLEPGGGNSHCSL